MGRTPAERLKTLRESRGYATAKEAADAFGWNEVTYRAHENGGRNMPYASVQKYAMAFGARPNAILHDADEPLAPGINHVTSVTLVGSVSAGVFREGAALEDREIRVPAVPRSDIPASAQYAVRIEGPSVNLRIQDGAFAICARFGSYPGGAKHGLLVHVVREHAGLVENTIKEYRFGPTGAFLAPVSSDPRFQEIVKLDDTLEDGLVRIEGVVIGQYLPM